MRISWRSNGFHVEIRSVPSWQTAKTTHGLRTIAVFIRSDLLIKGKYYLNLIILKVSTNPHDQSFQLYCIENISTTFVKLIYYEPDNKTLATEFVIIGVGM